MAATTPTKPTGPAPLVPPEEKFWKHYSPHGEAPMSLAGSVAFHALGVGGLILVAVYLASLFIKTNNKVPVETVSLITPGGGGKPGGAAGGPGGVGGKGDENVGEEPTVPDLAEPPRREALNKVEKQKIDQQFDADSSRWIQDSPTDAAKAFARLNDGFRRKLNDGAAPPGKGGTGSGGGQGTGTGKGVGPGTGEGRATLTKREKRMLRWHMRFTANTGPEYLQQLKGLGAILAFPLGDDSNPVFHVVHDLKPGATAQVENVGKLNRIYWIDDKPRSVQDILGALNLRLPGFPSRFVAFMPQPLEDKLFEMERRYVERVLRKKFEEDRIEETNFRVVPTGRGYQPELISVSMR